jgi:hypothetical protein
MDWQELLTWVLGIIATLLGGVNILQWITLRSYKRLKSAEADKSEIEALRSIIDTMQAEIGRLNQRVEDADRRAMENSNKYLKLYEDYSVLKGEFEQYKVSHKSTSKKSTKTAEPK